MPKAISIWRATLAKSVVRSGWPVRIQTHNHAGHTLRLSLPRCPSFIILLAGCALAGCNSKAQQAEQRYEMAKKSGSAEDICSQGRAVVAAYLEAGDEEKYKSRDRDTVMDCYNAKSAPESDLERVLSK